jgi:hypothetical protein
MQPSIQRSQTVTVLAILNIVFGGLGLLCSPVALLMQSFQSARFNRAMVPGLTNPAYQAWTTAGLILSCIIAAVLLAAGIGMLQLRPWSRTATIGVSILTLIRIGISLVLFGTLVAPALLAASAGGGSSMQVIASSALVGGIVGMLSGTIYPIVTLYFLNRPAVRDEFNPVPITPAAPASWPPGDV